MSKPVVKPNFFKILSILGSILILIFLLNLQLLPLQIENLWYQKTPKASIQLNAYQQLLKNYVIDGYVDYEKLKNDTLLSKCINELKFKTKLETPEDKLSYWINAYNLIIIKLICDKYPIKTIRDLGFDATHNKFIVNGTIISAQEIYLFLTNSMQVNKNLKPLFLTCNGSCGWPKLNSVLIDKNNIYDLAETQIEDFINNKDNVLFLAKQKRLLISQFFQMNLYYFDSVFKDVYNFILDYYNAPDKLEAYNITVERTFLPNYDWRINDTKYKPTIKK